MRVLYIRSMTMKIEYLVYTLMSKEVLVLVQVCEGAGISQWFVIH